MISGKSPRKESIPPTVMDAVYRTVHDYGVDRLAAQTGQSSGVIFNKCNPHATTPHLPTVPDVMVWQTVTGDHRILHAMAYALGETCLTLPELDSESDEAIVHTMLRVGAEGGDFCRTVNAALRDARLSPREMDAVRREGLQFIAAIAEALRRMEVMHRG